MISETSSNFDQNVAANAFSIEMNSSMFTMLTKNVYNNVILAPIREWSTNAIDACIAAKTPIKFDVHVPTISSPTFSVRDYGTGLPVEDIEGLFSILGASTKRDSNDYNGTFGIGRMSGLAYASSFTVESFHDGQHHSYLISVKDGIPSSVDLGSQPTTEDNGLRLSLTVESRDVEKFHKEAKFLYKFFEHKPNINIDIEEHPEIRIKGDGWFLTNTDYSNRSSYIVMGNVPYEINTYDYNMPYGLVITAPIGAVSITPGRESLTYDDKTNAFIQATMDKIKADIQSQYTSEFQSASTPVEQIKISYNYLNNFYSYITKPLTNAYMTIRYTSVEFRPAFTDAIPAEEYSDGKTRRRDTWSAHILDRNYKFLVLDHLQPSVHLQHYRKNLAYNTTLIIAKPTHRSNVGLERLRSTIDADMAAMGITDYDFISDHLLDIEAENQKKAALEARQFQAKCLYGDHSTGVYGIIDSEQDSQEFLYLNVDEDRDTLVACNEARTLLRSDLDKSVPTLILVPKKAKDLVAANDKFIPAVPRLQELLDSIGTLCIKSDALDFSTNFVKTLTEPHTVLDMYHANELHNKQATYFRANLSSISKVFTITTSTAPYTKDDIKVLYPRFFHYDAWSPNNLIHYMQLEDTIRAYKDTITRLGGNPDE